MSHRLAGLIGTTSLGAVTILSWLTAGLYFTAPRLADGTFETLIPYNFRWLPFTETLSIDMGILAAYITAEATEQGLGTCILGWLDSEKIQKICSLEGAVKLVITLGYAKEGYALREKKRKELAELVKEVNGYDEK